MTNRIKNYFLVKKYPFLLCRNRWSGKELDDKYAYTELDDMPKGWRKTFGKQICRDIKDLFINSGYKDFLNKYRITQIKEKYGQLRWYDNEVPEKIRNSLDEIIEYYTKLSEHTCIICGEKGSIDNSESWLSPLCNKHRNEINKR